MTELMLRGRSVWPPFPVFVLMRAPVPSSRDMEDYVQFAIRVFRNFTTIFDYLYRAEKKCSNPILEARFGRPSLTLGLLTVRVRLFTLLTPGTQAPSISINQLINEPLQGQKKIFRHTPKSDIHLDSAAPPCARPTDRRV